MILYSKQITTDNTSDFRKYIYFFFLFNTFSVCMMILCFCIALYFKVEAYHDLYLYQINKLHQYKSKIDTIFIGDSSLGNAINSSLFNSLTGLNSSNLALTGLYGYAGSYNMLKKAVKHNKIKNVIIINTLDMMSRPVAYDGYMYSMETLSDFTELTIQEKVEILKISIDNFFSVNNFKRILTFNKIQKRKKMPIEKDYIKQTKKMNIKKIKKITRMHTIKEKTNFLKKIINYSKKQNINLLYIHGPHFDNIDKKDIKKINTIIKETGIKFIENIYYLSREKVGDSLDHVHPAYKDMITKQYIKYIKDKLVY